MINKWKNLVIVAERRVFINVVYSGCGNGCVYCYEKSCKEKQIFASYEDLRNVVNYIMDNCLVEDTLISFCPNTEPLKCKESIDRVLFIMHLLKGKNCIFQISSKEYIDEQTLFELNDIANESPVFIDVSVPFCNSKYYEPHATPFDKRIQNIERIKRYKSLKCGLYIKPFTKEAEKYIVRYMEIISGFSPDYLCIGIAFDRKDETPCISLYKADRAKRLITNQRDDMIRFADEIREKCNVLVVYSSVCAINQLLGRTCSIRLWNYDELICKGCSYIDR